jgi:hypothetical protein
VKWLTVAADIRCDHDGRVANAPSQHWVSIAGRTVLIADDPVGKPVAACPNIGATMKPCLRTLRVAAGYSSWIRIGARPVVLDSLDGLTDGTLPGTVHYAVRHTHQHFVEGDR